MVKILNQAEKVVYDGAALALLVTVGMLFFSVEISMLVVFEIGLWRRRPRSSIGCF